MNLKVKEKGWVKKVFSREYGWGEDEPRLIEGLGWLIFTVEDTAGSVTLYLTKEKIEKIPFEEEEYKEFCLGSNLIDCAKVLYYGEFEPNEGKGLLYYKLNVEENRFEENIPFKDFEDSERVLEEYLNRYKTD